MPNWLKKITLLKISDFKFNPKNFNQLTFKKFIKGLVIFLVLLAVVITIKDEIIYELNNSFFNNSTEVAPGDAQGKEVTCNIAGIKLHGDVVTYITPGSKDKNGDPIVNETASENVIFAIKKAEADDSIKAILLEIDSSGGSPVGAEEMANALKRAKKPTVVLVRSIATSAAYWTATGANIIFASALSDIGSIGVTMSYVDNSKQNVKDGLTYNSLSTGKYKDYGDSKKTLTDDERKLVMRDLNILHENFVKAVATNRSLDIKKVRMLADGSSMPGQMALDNGLIDRIGGITEVMDYLKGKFDGEASVCW